MNWEMQDGSVVVMGELGQITCSFSYAFSHLLSCICEKPE